MHLSSSFLAVFAILAAAHANRLAELVPRDFTPKRAAYQGGWALALAGADCPSDAPEKCPTNSGLINPTCCPGGQFCKGGLWPYCCPTTGDCVNVVENLPVCANSTWNMYRLSKTQYFCCQPGQIGIIPARGYTGICGYPEQAIAASQLATIASQIGGQAVTTVIGNTGSGAQSTAITTVTSSGKGGATTIASVTKSTGGSTEAVVFGASITGSSSGSASTSTAGTDTKTMPLSLGAIIGIAVGGIFLLIVAIAAIFLVRKKKSAAAAASTPQEYGGGGGAPMYSAVPAPYGGAGEYKSPMVGYVQPVGSPNQAQGHHGGGYVRTQELSAQGAYGMPPPQQQQPYGGPPPVEAPGHWESRVEIGSGR